MPFGINRRFTADNAGQAVKTASPDPQFTIKRLFGQSGQKPAWRVDIFTAAKTQHLSIPDRTDAIKFFADQITGNINLFPIHAGQQDRGGHIVGSRHVQQSGCVSPHIARALLFDRVSVVGCRAFEAARQALLPNLSRNEPAARYGVKPL